MSNKSNFKGILLERSIGSINSKNIEIASLIVIITITVSQFMTFDITSVGPIVISADKLIAVIALPIALWLFGLKRLSISPLLFLFGFLLFLTFSAAHITSGNYRIVISAFVNILINGSVAVLLLTSLEMSKNTLRRFSVAWIIFSTVSSLIVTLQSYYLIPTVPGASTSEILGLLRGTGLIGEPCYMSLMLVLGVSFTLTQKDLRWKIPLVIIQSIGILYTMSRMGFFVLAFLYLLSPVYLGRESDNVFYRFSLIGIGLLLLISSFFLSIDITNILYMRSSEVFTFFTGSPLWRSDMLQHLSDSDHDFRKFILEVLKKDVSGHATGNIIRDANLTSTDTRFILLTQSIAGIKDFPIFGIGAWSVFDYMNNTVGLNNEVHNTYLEMVLTGGLAGWMTIGLFTASGIWVVLSKQIEITEDHSTTRLQIITFLLLILMISIIHFLLLWLMWVYIVYLYRDRISSQTAA